MAGREERFGGDLFGSAVPCNYKWIYILIVTMVISVISGLNNSHGYSHVIAMCNLNCALRKAMVSVFNIRGKGLL